MHSHRHTYVLLYLVLVYAFYNGEIQIFAENQLRLFQRAENALKFKHLMYNHSLKLNIF